MKRWEQMELKRIAENFSKWYCNRTYEFYKNSFLVGNTDLVGVLDDWKESNFSLSIRENKGIVRISLMGSSGFEHNEEIRISELAKAYRGTDYFFLKELILYLNELRVVPDEINIKCTWNKLRKLEADRVVLYHFEPFDFMV